MKTTNAVLLSIGCMVLGVSLGWFFKPESIGLANSNPNQPDRIGFMPSRPGLDGEKVLIVTRENSAGVKISCWLPELNRLYDLDSKEVEEETSKKGFIYAVLQLEGKWDIEELWPVFNKIEHAGFDRLWFGPTLLLLR